MKARLNPTPEQLKRRKWRGPVSCRDSRYLTDPYWLLINLGVPPGIARRAFRRVRPVREEIIPTVENSYSCDGTDDLLFHDNEPLLQYKIETREPLSSSTISSLPSRSNEYTVWHESVVGFGVRVRATGTKSYIVLYRKPYCRKAHKQTLGKVGLISFEEALKRAKKVLRGVRRPSISEQYYVELDMLAAKATENGAVLDGYPNVDTSR